MRLLAGLLALLLGGLWLAPAAAQSPTTGSISGMVVRADNGAPVAGAIVIVLVSSRDHIWLLEHDPDTERLLSLPHVTTDAQGRFVFPDLRPELYLVTAQGIGFARQEYGASPGRKGIPLTVVAGGRVQDIVFPLQRTGAISGSVADDRGEPIAGLSVQIQRRGYDATGRRSVRVAGTARTDDRGEYRAFGLTPGRYYVVAAPRQSDSRALAEAGYVAAYFPGVTHESAATLIDVAPGGEVQAIDFVLSRQRVFHVSGRFSEAEFAPDLVWLTPVERTPDEATYEGTLSKGHFEIENVVPGSYRIELGAGEVTLLTGLVDVSDADVEDVVLLSPPIQIPIDTRVRWEGPSASAHTRVGIALDRVEPPDLGEWFHTEPGVWNRITFAPGSHYRLRLLFPEDVYLKSAHLGAADVSRDLSVDGSVAASLDIVVSAKVGRIEGTIVDAEGRPMPGREAVLLPSRVTDRIRGRVLAASSDQRGHFDLPAVPPGNYTLFAWDDLEPYGYFDADFVRKYEREGTPVRVSESTGQRVQLRLIRVTP